MRLTTPAPKCWSNRYLRTPNGVRTRVTALKGRRPRPLDDGGSRNPVCTGPLGTHESIREAPAGTAGWSDQWVASTGFASLRTLGREPCEGNDRTNAFAEGGKRLGVHQGLLVVQPPDRQGWTSVEPHRSSVGSQVNRDQSRLAVNKINCHTTNGIH